MNGHLVLTSHVISNKKKMPSIVRLKFNCFPRRPSALTPVHVQASTHLYTAHHVYVRVRHMKHANDV